MIDISKLLQHKSSDGEDSQWLPVSDIMSGLMILFLFISVSMMLNTQKIASEYKDQQKEIYQALYNEFKDDLKDWNAEIDPKTLTFTFKSPDILFETGKSDLNEKYKEILTGFFPRYMKVIYPYNQDISEVRIEGHTSSEWNKLATEDEAYFFNMQLSQERTRAVLSYLYYLDSISEYREWIKSHIASVGLSSSHLIFDKNGQENKAASKRVTFRILTNADEKLIEILGDK